MPRSSGTGGPGAARALPRHLDEREGLAGRARGEDVAGADVLVDRNVEDPVPRRVAVEAVGQPSSLRVKVDDVVGFARVHGGDIDI
jgi:hypothetical protein